MLSKVKKFIQAHHFILLILILGVLLRILFLVTRTPTFDEAQSLMLTKTNLIQMVKGTMSDAHPPAYFLLIYCFSKINQNLLFLRSLSLLFGVLLIILINIIGEKIFNEKIGKIASLLAALSPAYVFDSTNLRMYSLVTLLSLLSLYLFIQWTKKPNKICFVILLLNLLLGLYTHYYYGLIILILNIYFFLKYWGKVNLRKRWIFLQFLVIFFSTPLAWLFLNSDHPQLLVTSNSIIKIPGVFVVFINSWDAIQISKLFPITSLNSLNLSFFCLSAFIILIFLYGFKLMISRPYFFLFFLYLFFPIFLIGIYSYFVEPIFGIRSFIIFSPPFYLITALGFNSLKKFSLKILLSIFLIFFYFFQFQSFKLTQESSTPYNFVKNNSFGKNVDLYVYSDPSLLVLGKYYIGGDGHRGIISTWIAPEMSKAMGYEILNMSDLETSQRFWYILLKNQYFNGELAQEKQTEMESKFKVLLTKEFDNQKIQVTLFQIK